jgi:signal transduction histidine kinase
MSYLTRESSVAATAKRGLPIWLALVGFGIWAVGLLVWPQSLALGAILSIIGGYVLASSLSSSVTTTQGRVWGVIVPITAALFLLSQSIVQAPISVRTVLLTFGVLCLILAFAFVVTQRSKAEREAAALVQDEQQRQLASEIHDAVGHTLAATMLHLSAARLALRTDPDTAIESLELAEKHGRRSISDIRSVVQLLRSGEPQSLGGIPAVSEIPRLVDDLHAAGADIEFTQSDVHSDLSAASTLTMYRVVQEGLTNAVRHGTGSIELHIAYGSDFVTVHITNAIGTAVSHIREGTGLTGMRHRVHEVGGTLDIHVDEAQRRWTLVARIPA